MKRITLSLLAIIALQVCSFAQDAKMKTYIDALMSKMTLQEKIGQLNLPTSGDVVTGSAKSSDIGAKIKKGQVGGLFNIRGVEKIKEVQRVAVEESRMKIPLLFGMDVIHGYRTTFPIPLGVSCTWNMAAIERSARIAAVEASAQGIGWTFSPMVDISRDPRWGRVSEGGGEDPYLGSEIAKAMVRGYQTKNLRDATSILSCVKHFAMYGAAEAGRDYNTTDMSRLTMHNVYLQPYKAAIDAGAGSVMASFNEVDGVPATGNKWLMTELLRKQWGFKGFVVTDYTGINEMIDHGMGDLKQSSALAMNAGIDMDMVGEGFLKTLEASVKDGSVKMAAIDNSCRLILEAKYKLGLFENPYKYCDLTRAEKDILTPEHKAAARAIAAESFVLLRNEGKVLPISKTKTVALIGPLANTKSNMPGTWSVSTDMKDATTVKEGLEQALGSKANLLYAFGSNLSSDSVFQQRATLFGRTIPRDRRPAEAIRQEALDIAAKADVIVAALGESSEMSGESSSRTNLLIPDVQKELLMELVKLGKPVVLVLFTGRPLALKWENENVPAILNVWFPGTEAGHAIADVLFGDVNPGGKLTTTFPQNVGQVPLYYNHKNTGRPLGDNKWFSKFKSNYLDVSNEPVYPFGFGLSYSDFSYSDIKLSSATLTTTGRITASVAITNNSNVDGFEVVQLYTRDLVGTVTRPVKELKGFKKVWIKAGQSVDVNFNITVQDLKFYNGAMQYVAEPGEFKLFIGTNSRDVKEVGFTLK